MFHIRRIALCLFLFLFVTHSLIAVVEDSIVPIIERLERVENLTKSKYATAQYEEIVAALSRQEQKIRVVTYNTLFDIYDKNLPEVYRWPSRVVRVVELIEETQPDILCVQELLPHQYEDLIPFLNETYAFYGETLSTGQEFFGIFYKKERFEVVQSHFLTTPDKQTSVLTMVELIDLKTALPLAIFNTHLSFSDVEKRVIQATLASEYIEPFAKKEAVLFMGDFNTFANRPDLEKLPFYDGDYIDRILTRYSLKDAKTLSLLGHLGPLGTFTNKGESTLPFKGTGTPGIFLDHMYVGGPLQVLIHGVQPAKVDGHFPSDHMPIVVDLVLF